MCRLYNNKGLVFCGKTDVSPFFKPLRVKRHTILDRPSSILSWFIVQKQSSNKNKLTASVTLKSGSKSTIYNTILSLKMVNQQTKFWRAQLYSFSRYCTKTSKYKKLVKGHCDLEKWVKVKNLQSHASPWGNLVAFLKSLALLFLKISSKTSQVLTKGQWPLWL